MSSLDSLGQNYRIMDENESKDLLESHGIKVPRRITVMDLPETISFDFPVVLKVCDPRILHKTDAGGVVLNIKDNGELQREFLRMKEHFPTSRFLIEKMEKQGSGVEVIVGVSRDDTFGLTIMFGLGGIYTELYRDIAIRVLPIEEVDAEEMISTIRAAKVFDGFRNIRVSRPALKEVLLRVAKLAQELQDNRLCELDLNPVLVRENDAIVLDAKVLFHA